MVAMPIRIIRWSLGRAIIWLPRRAFKGATTPPSGSTITTKSSPTFCSGSTRRRVGDRGIGEDDFVEGAPELIVEIAATSANYDMHDKKRVDAWNGVTEYLVVLTYEQQVHWFALREGRIRPACRLATTA